MSDINIGDRVQVSVPDVKSYTGRVVGLEVEAQVGGPIKNFAVVVPDPGQFPKVTDGVGHKVVVAACRNFPGV